MQLGNWLNKVRHLTLSVTHTGVLSRICTNPLLLRVKWLSLRPVFIKGNQNFLIFRNRYITESYSLTDNYKVDSRLFIQNDYPCLLDLRSLVNNAFRGKIFTQLNKINNFQPISTLQIVRDVLKWKPKLLDHDLPLCKQLDMDQSSGSYVEFNMPNIIEQDYSTTGGHNPIYGNQYYLNETDLNQWQSRVDYITKIHKDIGKIFHNYGYLPITKSQNKLKIYFPNKTPNETERLLIDLDIIHGNVFGRAFSSTEVLSSDNSSLESFVQLNNFSPVLSETL